MIVIKGLCMHMSLIACILLVFIVFNPCAALQHSSLPIEKYNHSANSAYSNSADHKTKNALISCPTDEYHQHATSTHKFSIQDKLIIKTKLSLQAGATIIASLHSNSKRNCINKCCSKKKCDTAIFETTTKNICYLFQCDQKCVFVPHVRYMVAFRKGSKGHSSQQVAHDSSKLLPPKTSDNPTRQAKGDDYYSDQTYYDIPQENNGPPDIHAHSKVKHKNHKLAKTDKEPAKSVETDKSASHTSVVKPKQTERQKVTHKDSFSPFVKSEAEIAVLEDRYRQSRVAVAALALGLGVAIFAGFLIAYRLYQVKHRIRRGGKALVSDEADYLINGMYL